MVTAKMVAELREKTGVGMMDCKKALTQTDGNMEKAIEFLRERGLAQAAKKSGRIAAEGIVESYIHGNGRIGVLVEVTSSPRTNGWSPSPSCPTRKSSWT